MILVLKNSLFLLLLFSSFTILAKEEKAVFAGGCFWCLEPPFEKLEGVISVESGYLGGSAKNPTYELVSSGTSGHIEAVEIVYDDSKVKFDELLKVFWKNVDPFDSKGQFCDKGEQYLSGVFYLNEEQKIAAQSSFKVNKEKFKDKKIATFLRKASTFYKAEDYHQDYYKKNPIRYKFYRYNCGRDQRLESIWGK